MGNNLPPLSPRQRRNAPWNQDHPTPEVDCTECDWYGYRDNLDQGCACPSCGSEQIAEV